MDDYGSDDVLYDLNACIAYNEIGFKYQDIAKVHALREGERDGKDYYWVMTLKNGQIGLLRGGQDYTGWD